MHTEHWGTATGRRALLLPGITSSAATMWEVGEGLAAAGWSAVAVDHPGHGESPPASSYRFADVAGAYSAELGGGWDLVVGHSLGGAIATVLLAAEPSFAARALLVDPALVVPDDVAGELAPELERDQAAPVPDLAALHPRWSGRTVAERVRSTLSTDVASVRGFVADNRPWDVLAPARQVAVPVHVLVPTDGPVVTAATVRALEGPLWTFETVPDTTHSLHRDDPSVVVDRAVR